MYILVFFLNAIFFFLRKYEHGKSCISSYLSISLSLCLSLSLLLSLSFSLSPSQAVPFSSPSQVSSWAGHGDETHHTIHEMQALRKWKRKKNKRTRPRRRNETLKTKRPWGKILTLDPGSIKEQRNRRWSQKGPFKTQPFIKWKIKRRLCLWRVVHSPASDTFRYLPFSIAVCS